MAVYAKDDPRLFYKAIESVYANTLLPRDFILVADGPLTVELDEVLEVWTKLRNNFIVHRLEINGGLANALNYGLRFVNTDIVVRADSDDINLPDRFKKQVVVLDSGCDITSSAILEVNYDGTPISVKSLPLTKSEILKYSKRRNPFNHMATAFKLEMYSKYGGYPEIYLKEDYAFWAKLLLNGATALNLDDVTVHATTGSGLYLRRGGLKYVLSEFSLQKYFYIIGFKSIFLSMIDFFVRSVVFLMPSFIKSLLYRKILRSNCR